MFDYDVQVSVCCLAYNQEKYIRRCLDGFIMQKCNFKFEILINDDASTDSTASIIREYENKYPNLIHAIYQSENQYSKGNLPVAPLFMSARGKYVAMCEGDDYWTDENKLQKQYDALESNPNCHMCVHMVEAVKEDGSYSGLFYPKKEYKVKTGELSVYDFLKVECMENNSFQTSSYFFWTSDIKQYCENKPLFAQKAASGDLAWLLYFCSVGNIYYVCDPMSCYRRGSSNSIERHKMETSTKDKQYERFKRQSEAMDEFDKYTDEKYHDLCQLKSNCLMFSLALRYCDYKEMVKKKYRVFMKKFSVKARLKIYIQACFNNFKR